MSRNRYPRKNIDRRKGLTTNRSKRALAEMYDATGMYVLSSTWLKLSLDTFHLKSNAVAMS